MTVGPTNTPPPTATPVSAESFQEEFDGLVAQFEDLGVSEAQYREIVRTQIYRERLIEELNIETELAVDAEQASFFVLQFETEAEANEALALVEDSTTCLCGMKFAARRLIWNLEQRLRPLRFCGEHKMQLRPI